MFDPDNLGGASSHPARRKRVTARHVVGFILLGFALAFGIHWLRENGFAPASSYRKPQTITITCPAPGPGEHVVAVATAGEPDQCRAYKGRRS